MKNEQLPQYKDFCPTGAPCLDQEHAAKSFLGKTLEEAECLFRENSFFYLEDLMYMGTPAFEFYLQAFLAYLISDNSRGDSGISGAFDLVFPWRYKHNQLGAATALTLKCVDYVIANFSKFEVDDVPEPSFQELMKDLKEDPEVSRLVSIYDVSPTEIDNFFNDIISIDERERDTLNAKSLSTLERWTALRASLASAINL